MKRLSFLEEICLYPSPIKRYVRDHKHDHEEAVMLVDFEDELHLWIFYTKEYDYAGDSLYGKWKQ